jgi:hypothetical protein
MATKDRIAALKLPRAPERRLGFLLGGRDGRLLPVTVLARLGQHASAQGQRQCLKGFATNDERG